MIRPRRVAFMLELDWPLKWHAGIFTGAQQYAEERGWDTVIDEFVVDTLSSRRGVEKTRYDGVIARATPALMKCSKRLRIPVVNVWYSSPVWKTTPGVYPDCEASGLIRAEHLLSRGFRRFAALITNEVRGANIELRAFEKRIGAAGGECVATSVPLTPSNSVKSWRENARIIEGAMDGWIPPIGVFVSDEFTGRMVAQMCHKRGWRVPHDVAIITGANDPIFCEGLHPTLSSVEFGYERIGCEAARLLESLMNGNKPPKSPVLVPPKGLVVRESTDFFAVEDELIASALKFIATNCHKPIDSQDVAKAVHTELRTLQRHFRRQLDRTIACEIRRVRIERAKRELTQTNRTIGEIAHEVGFRDNLHMYVVFRDVVGVTPSRYRKDRGMAKKR